MFTCLWGGNTLHMFISQTTHEMHKNCTNHVKCQRHDMP